MERLERAPDHEGTLRTITDDHGARMRHAGPGIVVSVSGQTCSVQPAIMESVPQQDGTDKAIQLPLLVNVPLIFQGGGGVGFTFPVSPGDEVEVIFNDRCIDAWFQSGGVQQQADARMHNLADAIAIPGLRSMARELHTISATSAQLRTDDGTVYVEVTQAKTINLVGPVTITGPLVVQGDVATTGALKNNNVNVGSTHTHTGVQTGTGTSGQPTP